MNKRKIIIIITIIVIFCLSLSAIAYIIQAELVTNFFKSKAINNYSYSELEDYCKSKGDSCPEDHCVSTCGGYGGPNSGGCIFFCTPKACKDKGNGCHDQCERCIK